MSFQEADKAKKDERCSDSLSLKKRSDFNPGAFFLGWQSLAHTKQRWNT
jgi:hypothetical protein